MGEILTRVEALSPRAVRFYLTAPRASFHSDLEFGIISAAHARPRDKALALARRTHAPPPALTGPEILGAGPYRIATTTQDGPTGAKRTRGHVLEANPFGIDKPRLPKLRLLPVLDDNARVLALVGGSGDLIENGVNPLVLDALLRRPGIQVYQGPSATLTYLGFNLNHPLLGNSKVRRAIALALDRDAIVRAKFSGRAKVARGVLATGNPFFVDVPMLEEGGPRVGTRDVLAANRMLDDAGYPKNSQGVRFSLVWKTSNSRFRVALVRVMARQLAAVGIQVDVRPFDFATFISDVRHGNFEMFTLQLANMVEPGMLRPFLHSAQIPTAENKFAGLNRFRFADPVVDAALDRGGRHADGAIRRQAYAQVQEAVWRHLPLFPLWHEDNLIVARDVVRDVQVLETGRLDGLITAQKRIAKTRVGDKRVMGAGALP